MPGGFIQLVANGHQNNYLTGNPDITYLKIIYRKQTFFALKSIEQSFDGTVDFGKKVSCNITRNGDLVNSMYLQVKFIKSNKKITWYKYINLIGNRMIEYISSIIIKYFKRNI